MEVNLPSQPRPPAGDPFGQRQLYDPGSFTQRDPRGHWKVPTAHSFTSIHSTVCVAAFISALYPAGQAA